MPWFTIEYLADLLQQRLTRSMLATRVGAGAEEYGRLIVEWVTVASSRPPPPPPQKKKKKKKKKKNEYAHPVATPPDSPMLSDTQLVTWLSSVTSTRPMSATCFSASAISGTVHRASRARSRSLTRAARRSSVTARPGSSASEPALGNASSSPRRHPRRVHRRRPRRDARAAVHDRPLSDLVLSTSIARREALQTVEGLGLQLVGPHSSDVTMRMPDFARSNRSPFPGTTSCLRRALPPSCACLVARSCGRPRRGGAARARHRPRARAARRDRPAGRRRRFAVLGAAVYSASELDTLVIESTVSAGKPAPRAGSRTTSASPPASPEPSSPAAPSPRRASSERGRRRPTGRPLEPGDDRQTARLEEEHEIAARARLPPRSGVPAPAGRRPPTFRGPQHLLAAGPLEAQLCGASRAGVVDGDNSAGEAGSGSRAVARSSR